MDWIRRNWPDMLIGIALIAVIAGIIATLLTGGSFFPLGASQASSSRPEQSSEFTSPGPVRAADEPEVTRSVAEETPEETPEETRLTSQATSDTPSSTSESDEGPVTVSALPLPGTGSQQERAAGAEPEPEQQQPSRSASDPAQVNAAAADRPGTYRISVGAFSGEENAQRQAQTFREAGYPVFIGTQGNLSIVLVGPYEELSEAERVAARIRGGGFRIEPVIYLFEGDTDSGASSAGRPQAREPAPTAAQATAGRFLQVGAYGTRESSLPQRERLEGLGFEVSERMESGLVKLLVGPFAGDELTEARALLNEQGIDHFPR
ncbi:MAG TPA: SPOR domain-containing protein [Trueperaceae bacterium]